MICNPVDPSTRRQLDDTINRMIDALAVDTAKYVQDGDLTLEALGQLMRRATELGKLTAVRDHDNVARAQEMRRVP